MLDKEGVRMLWLQIAALASIFAYRSPRLMAVVTLMQTLASPEIWAQIWGIIQKQASAALRVKGPGGLAMGPGGEAHEDAFGFLADHKSE